MAEGLPQRTYFDEFYDQGLSWKIYFEMFPSAVYVIAYKVLYMLILASRFLRNLRSPTYLINNYGILKQFESDAASGTLPQFSFIEPQYYSIPYYPANDQHPSHDVSQGKYQLSLVYRQRSRIVQLTFNSYR
jgi:phospholipase C